MLFLIALDGYGTFRALSSSNLAWQGGRFARLPILPPRQANEEPFRAVPAREVGLCRGVRAKASQTILALHVIFEQRC